MTTWQNLQHLSVHPPTLNQLFEKDNRHRYSAKACGIYMDYSKQILTDEILQTLIALAHERGLLAHIKSLLSGEKVNDTENRAALHTALRLPKDVAFFVKKKDLNQAVQESLDKVARLSERIRQGVWRGYSGAAITDVVNIGVGGSDLGPLMVTRALAEWADTSINVHFVSNMDGTQLDGLLKVLNPETTLFILSSKSFGTKDTLSNAQTALLWLLKNHNNKASVLRRHFIGISTNAEKMSKWGIHKDNQLLLWEWVGGRFSLWSAIGLTIAVLVGMEHFLALLHGAYQMDKHFESSDFEHNLPVLLGLIGVWNSTFLQINAHSVLPYDGRLSHFPAYLTQLEMESNGKSVNRLGQAVDYDTCPILWGEVGSNAQHAFYQLLHQGTQKVSCDFIAAIVRYADSQHNTPLIHQHKLSLANCLAQSQVLAFGNKALPTKDEALSHKQYRGNQPSTTLLLDELTPTTLGSLIALYEHKVYVMSVLWQINPFDQWGVEAGKVMADNVYQAMMSGDFQAFDGSTAALLNQICTMTLLHKE